MKVVADDCRGEPLEDTEVLFRFIKRASWLEKNGAIKDLAYLRDDSEAYLSLGRSSSVPGCDAICSNHQLKSTYGCDSIQVAEIRKVLQKYPEYDIYADTTDPHHAILDLPDPLDEHETDLATELSILLSNASRCQNRERCKDGQSKPSDRRCP